VVEEKKDKKVIVFDYDKMIRAGQVFNAIQFSGANNIRLAAELSNILDSGTVMELSEEEKECQNVDIK
jgi:hypothetical protein